MSFDVSLFFIGVAVASCFALILNWSEKQSLANRVAYMVSEQALRTIYRLLGNYDFGDAIDCFPYSDNFFDIKKLPNKSLGLEGAPVYGVYSKEYKVWLILEDIGYETTYWHRFICYPDSWDKRREILNPYKLDINKTIVSDWDFKK